MSQTFLLKVSIHCNACKRKVDKVLHKIEGVDQVDIDAKTGKVIVSGNVDPAILVKALKKAGRKAELLGSEDDGNNNQKPVKFDAPPQNNVDEEKDDDMVADDIDNGNGDNQNLSNRYMGDDNSDYNQNQGGGWNGWAQPMPWPYMWGQGFQGMQYPGPPMSHMWNINPARAVPPWYFQGGMDAPEMFAPPPDPYHQQYMDAAMMERQRMMMDRQGGGAANPPTSYDYEAPSYGSRAPRYGIFF